MAARPEREERASMVVAGGGDIVALRADQVRDALAHLHDLPYLQRHPLAMHVRTASNDSVQRAARRLQADLTEAIHALAPAPGGGAGRASTRAVRRHRVMALRYLDGLPVVEVQRRLAISRTEVFRAHREGLAAVAQFVQERWAEPQRGAAPAPTSGHDRRAALPALPARMVARFPRLPGQLTSFIGRERQLAALQRLVAGTGPASSPRARLITLVGAPGAGKTRLALQLAAGLDQAFAGRVAFIPLAAVGGPGYVLHTIALHLGIGEGAEQSLLERVAAALGHGRTLLLLDNFEHVVAARPCVAGLLVACPALTVVVTSREALHLSGEQQFLVPPLALPPVGWRSAAPSAPDPAAPDDAAPGEYEAVALFTERARAVLPEFAGNAQDAQTLAEICRRLDGLPLAIELAAARTKVLSPAALLARLERRLDLLTGGARDLPAHQQTLRRAIAWSYDLLPEHEQALLCRLAVFVGGWTLDAAQAVAGDARADGDDGGARVLDGVSSLLDKSLIQRGEGTPAEPRFTMLETIREFALARLERSPDAAAIRRRHAGYVVELLELAAPELRGPRESHALDLMEREHGNARAALDWCQRHPQPDGVAWALRLCAAVARYWWLRGYLTEGLERIRDVLGLVRTAPPEPSPPVVEAHAMTLFGAGVLAKYQGDFAAARAFQEEALATWKAAGDADGIGHAVLTLGNMLHQMGAVAEAKPLIEEALATLREAGDATGVAWAAIHLGGALLVLGEPEAAGPLLDQGVAAARGLGEHVATSWGLRYRAQLACALGRYAEATELLSEGLALSRALGDRRQMAQQLESLAEVAATQGAYEQAVGLAGSAQALRGAVGAPLAPIDRARQESWLVRAQAALGDQLRVVWEAGASAPLERTAIHST